MNHCADYSILLRYFCFPPLTLLCTRVLRDNEKEKEG